jgi:hypothetical protein
VAWPSKRSLHSRAETECAAARDRIVLGGDHAFSRAEPLECAIDGTRDERADHGRIVWADDGARTAFELYGFRRHPRTEAQRGELSLDLADGARSGYKASDAGGVAVADATRLLLGQPRICDGAPQKPSEWGRADRPCGFRQAITRTRAADTRSRSGLRSLDDAGLLECLCMRSDGVFVHTCSLG